MAGKRGVYERTPEIREKMRVSGRGIYERNPELREKSRKVTLEYLQTHPNPFKGRKHTEETKRKISESKKKNPWKPTQAQRMALSERLKGNQYRKGKPHTPGSRRKIGLRMRGENHPNWKGGKSPGLSRGRVEYIDWRKAVFERCGDSCAVCRGSKKPVAHHIKPTKDFPECEYDVENGIILCHSCHHAIHLIRALYENGVNSGKLLLIKQLVERGQS